MKNETIILASSSPRRIEMLQENGIRPLIMPPDVEETLPGPMTKEQTVMFLALKKALFVERGLSKDGTHSDSVIIAADTVVYKERIIGKPKDRDEAFRILSQLSGNSHYVVTGVAMLKPHTVVRQVFYDITKVFFKKYSQAELNAYVNTPEPYDKAGGYAIQGTFGKYVEHIEGDLDNVIGLPWYKIKAELNGFLL